MDSCNKSNSEVATVIQARDAEVGGMGSWTHSRGAKGIKSPGPEAKWDMWGDRGREINISGLGNVRDGRDMLRGRGDRKVSRFWGWGLGAHLSECVLFHMWHLL